MPISTKEQEPDTEYKAVNMGFGASLLAEAMAKSRAMCNSRKEDIFVVSDEETSSED